MRLAALALLLVGCTERTDLLAGDGGAAMVCSGQGAPVHFGAGGACAATVAANTLPRALCSCQSILLPGGLATSGPMGGMGPGGQAPPQFPGAGVASDGSIAVVGNVQLGGSLAASGSINFNRTALVGGGLHTGGSLVASTLATVGADAYVAGDVLGRVAVGGTLHISPTSDVTEMSGDDYNYIVVEDIDIAPPCGCADGPVVDVAALVAAAAKSNGDLAASLDPAALSDTHGPTSFNLPCGDYYLPSLRSDDTLEVHVQGRAALFIGGNVSLAQGLRVTLDDGASLDLFVAGDIAVTDGVLGSGSAVGTRLWSTAQTIELGSNASLSAIVYAPAAELQGGDGLTATGALFVGSVQTTGAVNLRFDPGVLDDSACTAATDLR